MTLPDGLFIVFMPEAAAVRRMTAQTPIAENAAIGKERFVSAAFHITGVFLRFPV